MAQFTIAAFYKFTPLAAPDELRSILWTACLQHEVKGTILLAEEGINGTICGPPQGLDCVLETLEAQPGLCDLKAKLSFADRCPFYRLKVRVKPEILSFGQRLNPNDPVGVYVDPHQWNDLIDDPEVLLLDTRNDYEVAVGTFAQAIDPRLDSFRQFPDYIRQHLNPQQHKKISMFCTGGIRCEKASAYLLSQGFEAVYQLHGGILNYLEEVPQDQSRWRGECFVFDQRVSVDHALQQGRFALCYACQHPLDDADRVSQHFEQGVSCPYCFDQLSKSKRARLQQRQRQVELAARRGQQHIGRTGLNDR